MVMFMFEGENGLIIIIYWNCKVFDVLKCELGVGKKWIGVFYGVGYLLDME